MSHPVNDQITDQLIDLLAGDNPSAGAIKKAQELIEKFDLEFSINQIRRLIHESYQDTSK